MRTVFPRLFIAALTALLPTACGGGGGNVASAPSIPQTHSVGTLSQSSTGNWAPSGTHYTMNIIGVSNPKNASMTGSDGHTIFVNLNGTSDIWLSQSYNGTFQVLDANGTDTTTSTCDSYATCGGAEFQLPAPGTYNIYAETLGKPGGSVQLTTCAYDTSVSPAVLVCSTSNYVKARTAGKSGFQNVTTPLTTITIDPTLFASLGLTCSSYTVNIFDPCLQNYFWQYDNNGLKHLQLRFYPT
jgi:hypothetical protein